MNKNFTVLDVSCAQEWDRFSRRFNARWWCSSAIPNVRNYLSHIVRLYLTFNDCNTPRIECWRKTAYVQSIDYIPPTHRKANWLPCEGGGYTKKGSGSFWKTAYCPSKPLSSTTSRLRSDQCPGFFPSPGIQSKVTCQSNRSLLCRSMRF